MSGGSAIHLASRPRLHLIAAALPPTLDGIGDYTALLAAELSNHADVVILTACDAEQPTPISNVEIRRVFDLRRPASVSSIVDEVQHDRPDWVVLQYNPFAYGRRGLNLHLPRAMRQLRDSLPCTRLAVMFHETYVPLINLKFAVMTMWQRWQFRQLARAADRLFFSISPWMEHHCRSFPAKPMCHLPVGSNIPRVPIDRGEVRKSLQISDRTLVLGIFGTAHASRMFDLVADATRAVRGAGYDAAVLYIGPDGQRVRRELADLPVISTDAAVDASEVSRRLAAIDICLTPYTDGVSTRRGAMVAALQHGLPCVGTCGHHTDDLLRRTDGTALLLADVRDREGFCQRVITLAKDSELRRQLSTGAEALYRSVFAWDVIAERLLATLRAAPATPNSDPALPFSDKSPVEAFPC